MLVVRQIVVVTGGAGNSKDAQAVVRHVQDLLHDQLLLCLWHVTQIKDRLWRTLGGYAATSGVHLPRVRQGQHMARKRILALQLPVFVKVFSPFEGALPHVQDGTLHGVEGVGFTGQDRVLDQFMEPFRKDSGQSCCGDVNILAAGRQFADGHLVHREGTSLVDAQDGRRPQGLDGRHAAGQDLVLRHAPGAHGHEDGQDHGELLGQDAHGHGQTGQEASLPGDEIVAASETEHDRDDDAEADADQTHVAHEIGNLVLERWFLGVHGLKCFADLSQFGPESSAPHFGDALSGND